MAQMLTQMLEQNVLLHAVVKFVLLVVRMGVRLFQRGHRILTFRRT